MDVKVCDSCGRRIEDIYFTVEKGHTNSFMSTTITFNHQRPRFPADVHPYEECIKVLFEKEYRSGVQET